MIEKHPFPVENENHVKQEDNNNNNLDGIISLIKPLQVINTETDLFHDKLTVSIYVHIKSDHNIKNKRTYLSKLKNFLSSQFCSRNFYKS